MEYTGKFPYSGAPRGWQSLCRDVQRQGGQAVEVHIFDCGDQIAFPSAANAGVLRPSLKDIQEWFSSLSV